MPKAESNINYSSFFTSKAFFYASLIFVLGLFFSRAVLSISCVLLLLSSISANYLQPKKIHLKPIYLLFAILYLANVLSGLYSEDLEQWKVILFRNSVFLIIPLAFLFSKGLREKQLNQIFLFFIICCLFCVSVNSIAAFLNYQQFLNDINNSKNIKSVIGPGHAELSILAVITFVLLIYFILKENIKKQRFILVSLLVFLFICIHLVAYRFAILSIYVLVFIYLLHGVIIKRKTKHLIVLILLAIAAFIGIITIPSVQKRYQNTVTDIQSILENKNPNYQSIGQRWAAVKCAFEVIKTHPLLGTSAADAGFEMQKQYQKNSYLLIPENRIFIHNQFIYLILCFGIPFSLIFILILTFVIYKGIKTHQLFIWLIIPFLFHMMIENTLEKQITANAFVFLLLLLFNHFNTPKPNISTNKNGYSKNNLSNI